MKISGTVTTQRVIRKNGKPYAVVVDIKKYQQLLEMLEEKKDLAEINRIKHGKPVFREL